MSPPFFARTKKEAGNYRNYWLILIPIRVFEISSPVIPSLF